MQLTENHDEQRTSESPRVEVSARSLVRSGPGAECTHSSELGELADVAAAAAAKARIVERLSTGDVRVLAGEVRESIELLSRSLAVEPAGVVVAFDPARRGRR